MRAAELAKCDLTTELVKEFTELQGVVGGLYARAQGEPEPVWQAIYDHYKPESMEDSIPRNRTGQMVSLADKLDTLRGCFRRRPDSHRLARSVRAAPRGAGRGQDSGGRQAWTSPLLAADRRRCRSSNDFFEDRVKFYFKDIRGFKYDEVNAAMAAGWSNLVDLEARLVRIQNLRPIARFRAAGRQLQAHPEHSGARRSSRAARRSTPALLEPGPESESIRRINRRIAGQPIETVIWRAAAQSGSVFRQGAGECAGCPRPAQSFDHAARRCWKSFARLRIFRKL